MSDEVPIFDTTLRSLDDDCLVLDIAAASSPDSIFESQPCKPRSYNDRVTDGTQLWQSFALSLKKEFYESITQAKNSGTPLKVVLDIQTAALRDLDWESLYDPDKQRFLIEDPTIHFFRASPNPVFDGQAGWKLPLKVIFIAIGTESIKSRKFIDDNLSVLVDIGSLDYRFEALQKVRQKLDPATSVFHLLIENSAGLLSQAGDSHVWNSESSTKRNEWDRLRALLPATAIGVASFVGKNCGSENRQLLDSLHRKGWPLFCRLDLHDGDALEAKAFADLYSLVGRSIDEDRLASVLTRQIALDDHRSARPRTIQFFCNPSDSINRFVESERVENPLQQYLRSAITAVEDFYQWERMYAELLFSTRLRLHETDLTDVDDVRQIQERTFHLNDALLEFPSIVILGEPGTGKTTACKRAAWEFATKAFKELSHASKSQRPRIPIYVPLKSLSGQTGTGQVITNYILRQFSRAGFPDDLGGLIAKFHLVLLLDGLNEVSPPKLRRNLVDEVLGIENQFKNKITIVVASRKHDFDVARFRRSAAFKLLEIIELSPADIKRFAKCYLLNDASVELFYGSLNRQLQSSARNPLVLKLLIDDFKQGESLIGSRAQLLEGFCRRCLQNPCEVYAEPTAKQVLRKERILTALAYATWSAGFSLRARLKEDCIPLITPQVGNDHEARKVLTEIAENGIVSIYDDDNGTEWVEFTFQSYHEYFCARKVAKLWIDGQTRDFRRLVRQDDWEEIIALSAGVLEIERKRSTPDKKKYEKELITELQKKRRVILAGKCVWNMEGMTEELAQFENWLVDRSHSACRVMTRISSYSLFFVILPAWLFALVVAMVWGGSSEYYLFSFRGFRLGTGYLIALAAYVLTPLALYYLFRQVSNWVATRQEDLVLRPSLAALYFIGSDFARASIVDLFSERDIASTLETEGDDLKKLDPTLKIQRRALKGIKDFSPSRTYNPEDLLELVNSDANARDICLLARIVAKDFSLHSLRRLAQLANDGASSVAVKAQQAGEVLISTNTELREEWRSLVINQSSPEVYLPLNKRKGFAYGLWEQFVTSSRKDRVNFVAALIFVSAIGWAIISTQPVFLFGAILGLATNLVSSRLLKSLK